MDALTEWRLLLRRHSSNRDYRGRRGGERRARGRRLKPEMCPNPSREGVLESRGEKITSHYSVERHAGLREMRLVRGRKVTSYPSLTQNKDATDELGHGWTRTQ